MRATLCGWAAILVASSMPAPAVAQSNVSKQTQIEAELLMQEIRAAASAGNSARALDLIASYRKTGVSVPPPLTLLEANIAHLSGDNLRSLRSVSEYLAAANREDPQYPGAITLLGRVREPALQQDRQRCMAWRKANPIVFPIVNGTRYQLCEDGPTMFVFAGGEFEYGRTTQCDPASRRCRKSITVPGKMFQTEPFALVGQVSRNCQLFGVCGPENFARQISLLSQRSGLSFTSVSSSQAVYAYHCGAPAMSHNLVRTANATEYSYANGCNLSLPEYIRDPYILILKDEGKYAKIEPYSISFIDSDGGTPTHFMASTPLPRAATPTQAAAVQP